MKMRRTMLRIAPIAFAAATFWTPLSFAKDEPRIEALRAAEIRRFEANVNADAKVLGELLDDGLEYVHSNGELDSKQSFMDSLTSGRLDYTNSTPEIESIRILGDVAIIRGKAKIGVLVAGHSHELEIGYTDVWLWKNGRWQMTAWRSARMPDAPAR